MTRTEVEAVEQDRKLTELIANLVLVAQWTGRDDPRYAATPEELEEATDALHEYIADLRGDSAALLDVLEDVHGRIDDAHNRYRHFLMDAEFCDRVSDLLHKYGRLS